jgi:hypothetical protein
MTGYVFYYNETTGTMTPYDQILEFGAIPTDKNLSELERFENPAYHLDNDREGN